MEQTTIFELIGITYDSEFAVERNINKSAFGLYSSLEIAENAIKEVTSHPLWDYSAYLIKERVVNPDIRGNGFKSYRTYNCEGEKNDECLCGEFETDVFFGRHIDSISFKELSFQGRHSDRIRFKKGDIVWVLRNNSIKLGIVEATPVTPEWYNERRSYFENNFKDYPLGFGMDANYDCYVIDYIGEGDSRAHELCPKVFPVNENIPESITEQLKVKLEENSAKFRGFLKAEPLYEDDLILFNTNDPARHIWEMFGDHPLNTENFEKEEYIGLITSTIIPNILYAAVSISPLDGFLCTVGKDDIIRKMEESELTEEQQNTIKSQLKKQTT